MTVKKGQTLDLEVTGIAFGGKGIAKLNGFTIFVDRAVPMDHVTARIIRKKKSHAEARVIELKRPSPNRIDPPCPYSGTCGGCKWQFLDYPVQLDYKRRHVGEALAHIGSIHDVPVHPTLPSESMFHYRNKMEFSCTDRRWLMPEELGNPEAERGFALGLHVPGTFAKVLDISRCLLMPDFGNTILGEARRYFRESPLPPYGLKSHEGFWRFLMLRHSAAHDRWMVNIITKTENLPAVRPFAERLKADFPSVASVINNITARKAGIALGEYERVLCGESVIRDRIGAHTFEVSANSFFQTNTRGAERLYETVRKYAALTGDETVLDLYCGTGTIAIYLSGAAGSVTGIEIVENAVADAERNARLNGISNCRFIAADIKDALAGIDTAPQVMIIDPPRAGMHPDVVKRVLSLAPPRIVYVSCNPATLARDLSELVSLYDVREVQPVDMFPHTFHIECVARLERK